MSAIITTTGRSVSTVTAEIVAISNQAAQMAYMSMVEIGRRLVEVKALVPHGEWGDYLKNEVKFSHRTANNFMQIYERSLNSANSQTFANLGYSHIVKLLALPDEELAEFTEESDVGKMSVRQLAQAIKERDEAQAKTRDVEQQLLTQQLRTADAERSEQSWKEEASKLQTSLNKATAEADKAKKQVKELKQNPRLSDEQREKLVAAAKAEAAEAARAEVKDQLDAATAAAETALQGKEAAEKLAQDLQAQLDDARKSSQLSNPDVAAFRLLCKQVNSEFNQLAGYCMKVGVKDPETAEKMKGFMLKLADVLRAAAEKTSKGGGSNVEHNQ